MFRQRPRRELTHRYTQSGSGLYDRTANLLTGSNLRHNEIHAPQLTKRGITFGNFIGPNTDIVGRIKDGTEPVSEADTISQTHDIRYSLAESNADIRDADKKMLKRIKHAKKNKLDFKTNLKIAEKPIQAKIIAEDLRLIKKGSFGDVGSKEKLDPEDVELLKNKLSKLEQKGYGKKNKRPLSAWQLHVSATRKKNKNLSFKEILKLAKSSYQRPQQ